MNKNTIIKVGFSNTSPWSWVGTVAELRKDKTMLHHSDKKMILDAVKWANYGNGVESINFENGMTLTFDYQPHQELFPGVRSSLKELTVGK